MHTANESFSQCCSQINQDCESSSLKKTQDWVEMSDSCDNDIVQHVSG